jgi:MYXO-CTERM domain-containing protein
VARTFSFARGLCILIAPIFVAALLVARPALSAPINYGDFSGNTVSYLQVTEDANSAGDNPPLFGPPTVAGDSIDFDPVGFNASTQNGGTDITDGNLKFSIKAKTGHAITNLSIAEAGDVTLGGFGTDTTFASVTTHIFLDVVEVDGVPINTVSNNNLSIPFNPSGGTFGLGTDGGGGPLFSSSWSGQASVNLNSFLTSQGVPFVFGATKVNINLDNTLLAISQQDTSVLIAKKNANGVVITVNTPEPATGLLALLGLAGLAASRRR